MTSDAVTPMTESDDFELEELDADIDDIDDAFPAGNQAHKPPSEADAPAPG